MRKLSFLLLVLFLHLSLYSAAFSQEDEDSKPKFVYTVKGRIVDSEGKPMPDASIIFEKEGHNNRVLAASTSDKNGNFIIHKTTDEETPNWIIAAENLSHSRTALLYVSSFTGAWEVTDYYPDLKGKKLELRANQVTDLGDVSLTLFYQPVSLVLKDANGEKIKVIEESDTNVFLELFSPNGDKLTELDTSIKSDKDVISNFEILVPKGEWEVRVKLGGDYDLEGTVELDVKENEKQEIDVTLKKSGEENERLNPLTINRAEALKELERRKIEISEESLLKRIDKGNLRAVELLLAVGVNPNTKNKEGDTVLYYAVENDKTKLARALIDFSADLTVRNEYEETLLMRAAFNGNVEIVKELIYRGADVNAHSRIDGTPLMSAAWSDSPETINALIDAGAEVNAKDSSEGTALMLVYESAEVAETLIRRGAKVNAKDEDGKTALLHQFDLNKDKDVIETLLKHGANPNIKDKSGNTPLLEAIALNDTGIIELLKSYGAKDTKETLLMQAVLDNDVKQVRELLRQGANPNISTQERWTPLLRATQENNLEIVRMLLDKKADVNARLERGGTPLILALRNETNIEVIKLLLSKGADINAKDVDGETALFYAIRSNLEFVKFFIDNGANVNIKDNNGQTPLRLAKIQNNKEIVSLLKKAGAE